jgi:hypothetical protein
MPWCRGHRQLRQLTTSAALQDLSLTPFATFSTMTCQPAAVFVASEYPLRLPWLVCGGGRAVVPREPDSTLGGTHGQATEVPLAVAPLQFHALVIAFFASAIAPFGGFFASGVKRAYDLKVGTRCPLPRTGTWSSLTTAAHRTLVTRSPAMAASRTGNDAVYTRNTGH